MKKTTILFRYASIPRILGVDIPREEVHRIFKGIGCEIFSEFPGSFYCRVPSNRPDLTIEENLITELLRFHGIENL